MRALADGVTSSREEADRKIAALEERLSARIATLEQVVRHHSEEIRSLRLEVAELRLRFDRRDLRLDELEARVAAVEKRLGVG